MRTGNMKRVEGVCAPARSRMAAATGSCDILTSLQTFTSIKTNCNGIVDRNEMSKCVSGIIPTMQGYLRAPEMLSYVIVNMNTPNHVCVMNQTLFQ